jgi:hypothetical protein
MSLWPAKFRDEKYKILGPWLSRVIQAIWKVWVMTVSSSWMVLKIKVDKSNPWIYPLAIMRISRTPGISHLLVRGSCSIFLRQRNGGVVSGELGPLDAHGISSRLN